MKALSSMATRHVLADAFEAAARAGLPSIDLESVGGVDGSRRVRAGEPFDLVLLADGALGALAREGHVNAGTVVPFVLSDVAVAVPLDAGPQADGPLTGAADVRAALARARRIGYSTGPSGDGLLTLIDGWGMTDELRDRLVQAVPGVPVAELVARGDVDLGFQQLSEIAGHPGVRVLGVLPSDCAITTVFSGAVAAASADPAAARRALDFLTSDALRPLRERHGFRSPGE